MPPYNFRCSVRRFGLMDQDCLSLFLIWTMDYIMDTLNIHVSSWKLPSEFHQCYIPMMWDFSLTFTQFMWRIRGKGGLNNLKLPAFIRIFHNIPQPLYQKHRNFSPNRNVTLVEIRWSSHGVSKNRRRSSLHLVWIKSTLTTHVVLTLAVLTSFQISRKTVIIIGQRPLQAHETSKPTFFAIYGSARTSHAPCVHASVFGKVYRSFISVAFLWMG